MKSISSGEVNFGDCQFTSTKKAEPLLTLPAIVIHAIRDYFLNSFLNRLNPNVAPPVIKSIELMGSGAIL